MNFNRWRKWSLPSKLTAIGTIVGIISLLISLILIFKDNIRRDISSKGKNLLNQKIPINNPQPNTTNDEQSSTIPLKSTPKSLNQVIETKRKDTINPEINELVDILNGHAELIRSLFDVKEIMYTELNRPDSVKKYGILRKDFERLHKQVIDALKMNNLTLYHQLYDDMIEFLRITFPGGKGITPIYKDE